MGLFWESATEQAGRQFGARHYRWFVAARVARAAAPGVAGLAIVAGVFFGARWIIDRWPTISGAAGDWTSAASATGPVLLWVLAIAIGLVIVSAAAVLIARNWWRLSYRMPLWMRRY